MKLRKYAALGLALIAPFGLSSCMILPGEFTSEMTLLKSGEFTFAYKGQIQLMGLTSLLNDSLDAAAAKNAEFTATCYKNFDESTSTDGSDQDAAEIAFGKKTKGYISSTITALALQSNAADPSADFADLNKEETPPAADEPKAETEATEDVVAAAPVDDYGSSERPCTEKETKKQKADWDVQQKEKKDTEAQMKKLIATMFGGIDPKNPKTIDRFTREIERMAAWNKVEHLGNGLFMIDYSTKGRLADNFAFPVIPRYAIGEPMIHITRWDNGKVRVEAPAFHSDSNFTTLAMMGGGVAAAMADEKVPDLQPIAVSGKFTLRTDARILANNTEEGPAETQDMQTLSWDIGPATFGPPMALLKLVQ
jgi:hypothetical protein